MGFIGKVKHKAKRLLEEAYRKYVGYVPSYNRTSGINSQEPEIYNRNGERMHVFFLSDKNYAHDPYSIFWQDMNYILWDRYNFGLKTHFYTDALMFKTTGSPDRRFAVQLEPRVIDPKSHDRILKNRSWIENEFDTLFTDSEELLSAVSNARFFPGSCTYWYGKQCSSAISPENYKNKNKNISIIASNKAMCKMHFVRQETARRCLANNWADTFGKFTGGGVYVPIELPFQYYRYSIVIENSITPFYFTEKLTNCFISQTIPIYLGATQIHKFFNPDGIITISLEDLDRLDEVLKQCTPEEYERRLPAILDNYERVQEYSSSWDWLYLHYLKQ